MLINYKVLLVLNMCVLTVSSKTLGAHPILPSFLRTSDMVGIFEFLREDKYTVTDKRDHLVYDD